jgi:hypothetical protein
LFLRKSLQNFIPCSLEDPGQRFLDQWNNFLAKKIEILIDCLIDDISQNSVATKKIVEIQATSLHFDFYIQLGYNQVRFSIDDFPLSSDLHITISIGYFIKKSFIKLLDVFPSLENKSLTKIPSKSPGTFNGQKQDSTINIVLPSDEKMGQL